MRTTLLVSVIGIGVLGMVLPLAAEDAPVAPQKLGGVPGLPVALEVVNSPTHARLAPDGAFELGAAGHTNLFNSPGGGAVRGNAPMALFDANGDFILSARVEAPLLQVYDVAALVVFENEGSWAKLCYENSVENEPTVVSVVTRGVSDDCNSAPVEAGFVYLGIVRRGDEFAFHWSKDGRAWRMVRHFSLAAKGPLKLGFAVHAYGQGSLDARFSEIHYTATTPGSVRTFPR